MSGKSLDSAPARPGLGAFLGLRRPAPPAVAASPDAALVAAAQGGSAAAFARLVERHQQALRAFLRRICGDWALADDLAQETLITAWSRIGALQAGASVRAWLCGIGHRKHLTLRRSAGRARTRDAAWEAERPTTTAALTEDRLALEAVLRTLPDDQRACVALCLAADFSHAEAAEALGLPLGTVKSHVTRGRARLLDVLGGSHD
ncbi:MAG: RNA polymerase sigma factor [Caulobacterales bacterium]|nr:RNA polymerase sigma factor [Caulobacterales bacterium]